MARHAAGLAARQGGAPAQARRAGSGSGGGRGERRAAADTQLSAQEEQQKVTKLKRAVDIMEVDVQDLLAEKDTYIANQDATISALEQEKHMARTRMSRAEDAIADERQRYASLEQRNREVEQGLEMAKRVKERQEHLEMTKMENERSLLELRQRNDDLREEINHKDMQLALLEERVSHDGSTIEDLKTKIVGLESASQLHIKHLETVTVQESSLKEELKAVQQDKNEADDRLRTCEDSLSSAKKEAETLQTVIHQLSIKVQQLEEEKKEFRDAADKVERSERKTIADIERRFSSENESLKAENAGLARELESTSRELKELRGRYEAKEGKYRSQRDLLARQVCRSSYLPQAQISICIVPI